MTTRNSIAFPEIGQIRKGGAKQKIVREGKEIETMGKDLNNAFRVVFYPGNEETAKLFETVNKDQGGLTPKRISCMLPFPNVWDNFTWHNEAYNFGCMVAQADDDHFITLRDPETRNFIVKNGEPFRPFTPGEKIEYKKGDKVISLPIKTYNRLNVFIPYLRRMVYLKLVSTSFYDRIEIERNLAAIQQVANMVNNGNAAGIPIWLYRAPQEVARPGGSRVTKYVVHIEADGDWVEKAVARLSTMAMSGGDLLSLMAPKPTLAMPKNAPDPEEDDQEDEHEYSNNPENENSDFQDGDFRPAPPEPENPEDQQAPATSTQAAPMPATIMRPYPPETLKSKILERVKSYAGKQASKSQFGLCRGLLDKVVFVQGATNEEIKVRRGKLQAYLTNLRNFDDIPAEYILAMLEWLAGVKDSGGDWQPSKYACDEAVLVIGEQDRIEVELYGNPPQQQELFNNGNKK